MRLDANEMKREMYRGLVELGRTRFGAADWHTAMRKYQKRPREFALKVLGSRWWYAQEEIGAALVSHNRVAVRSGHGVGKTYLAANIRLPGRLLRTKLELSDESYAMGIATESSGKGVNFQGCHADNLLIVIDEASGVPPDIWEAAEGAAVGRNNKILAIGNPLMTTGRFYDIFKGSSKSGAWHKRTISAMNHPNITGKGRSIPGCITNAWLESRIVEWCEEAEEGVQVFRSTGVADPACTVPEHLNTRTPEHPDVFSWKGKLYAPSDTFRIRVLGEFPRSEDTSLIPLAWIEAAVNRSIPPGSGPKRAAVDVARYGDDLTVIGIRQGQKLLSIQPVKGENTMQVATRVENLAYAEHPSAITIDVAGLGAGVVDRLVQLDIDGIDPFNSSSAPFRRDVFANRRAELYWGLRDQFRDGSIDIQDDRALCEELAAIRYHINPRGLIQIESKDEIKRRLGRSPDRADMLAMLFDNAYDAVSFMAPTHHEPSDRERFRSEMRIW
jgi:phage terminase large subunit